MRSNWNTPFTYWPSSTRRNWRCIHLPSMLAEGAWPVPNTMPPAFCCSGVPAGRFPHHGSNQAIVLYGGVKERILQIWLAGHRRASQCVIQPERRITDGLKTKRRKEQPRRESRSHGFWDKQRIVGAMIDLECFQVLL